MFSHKWYVYTDTDRIFPLNAACRVFVHTYAHVRMCCGVCNPEISLTGDVNLFVFDILL